MRYVRPRYVTGSNGLPVATIARPSDQRTASSASADSEAMAASLLPADMALAAATEDTQER